MNSREVASRVFFWESWPGWQDTGLSPQGDKRGEATSSTTIPPGKRHPPLHFARLACLWYKKNYLCRERSQSLAADGNPQLPYIDFHSTVCTLCAHGAMATRSQD